MGFFDDWLFFSWYFNLSLRIMIKEKSLDINTHLKSSDTVYLIKKSPNKSETIKNTDKYSKKYSLFTDAHWHISLFYWKYHKFDQGFDKLVINFWKFGHWWINIIENFLIKDQKMKLSLEKSAYRFAGYLLCIKTPGISIDFIHLFSWLWCNGNTGKKPA